MFTCEHCGKNSTVAFAPCPEEREGCCVAHYDANSYICEHCGHDNREQCAEAMMKGPHIMEVGIGMGNIKSISKLELHSED